MLGVAGAQPALAQTDVSVGGGGSFGSVQITITAPPSGGGDDGGSAPSGGGGGTAPVSNGGGASDGGSAPTGPSYIPGLDSYGSVGCSSTGNAACIAGGSGGLSAGFLNSVGLAGCQLGGACPGTGAATAGAPATPTPPPPPSPAQVAQIAIAQLGLRAGTPRLSANPNTAVGLPVWMWVDRSPQTTGPQSVTAALGPTVVTATAVLSRITWSMGPAGAVAVCNGPGTPAPARLLFQGDNSPDCGYSYAQRSLPERTGGTGRWPVTATSTFAITWVGGGQVGAQTLTLSAATSVEVGELQAVVTGGS
ncbi:hypothetical protein GCM10027047_16910 [Rhodococcus aerolatus]